MNSCLTSSSEETSRAVSSAVNWIVATPSFWKRITGSAAGNAAVHVAHDLARDVGRLPLDVIEVRVVPDADADLDEHLRIGTREVRGDRRRELRVRHDEKAASGLADARVAPRDVLDDALLARVQAHEVAGLDLPGEEDVETREEVRESVLERERHREASDAEGRDERRDRDAERLEDDEKAEEKHEAAGEVRHHRRRWQGADRGVRADETARDARERPRDGRDQHDEQDVPDDA